MLQPKASFFALLFLALHFNLSAQAVTKALAAAFARFEGDSQLKNASASICVVNANGAVVFQKNEAIGLAPASTQKIITSATAYELLGTTFKYQTRFGYLTNGDSTRQLYIRGSGDPTLGSFRWKMTAADATVQRIVEAAPGGAFGNVVLIDAAGWDAEPVPGGWMWDDIGNYYGAGASVLNWMENQYDVFLKSGSTVGSPVVVTGTKPTLEGFALRSKAVAAAKGSGDNAYIYFPLVGDSAVVRGTIPAGENRFVISGALPSGASQFAATLLKQLHRADTSLQISITTGTAPPSQTVRYFHTETAPPLDSIIYWFNKRSINLYGEALLKTIGYQKGGAGSTEKGMDILKSFWRSKGIAETALNLVDGSGLSPLNRVTTGAQVAVLQYAKKQPWFGGFYNALPEYNGMKLKSGTIHGVKGFAGYHTARNGAQYTVSFLVNNYNGPAAALVQKMYAVLDVLK